MTEPAQPGAAAPSGRRALGVLVQIAVWGAIALPALYQLALLLQAIVGRVGYPHDLEWMEGGMLHHAQRISQGEGIYGPPSVEFIPYLYTPLYPTVLALISAPLGISYLVGRMISVVALCGIACVALASFTDARHRHAGATAGGLALALGLFAACYPFVEGWYDLVRADTLFLFLVTAGLAGLPSWAADDDGMVGHAKVAAGAALLALAFFCKQTAIFYVGLGGAIVVVRNWRRAPTYVAVAGLLGLGGVWIFDRATRGWFWTYVSEIHRAHDFNIDRFTASFRNILWHFPALTIVVGATLLVIAITSVRLRGAPPGSRPFLGWAAAYAVSTVVGAIGWGTEFAHFNAYMPALLHGARAAGAAVPALVGCARGALGPRRATEPVATALALAAAVPLAVTCVTARWEPARFIPGEADATAGRRLVARLAAIDGDIWIPSHPWYAQLAGKAPHVHRMGIKDVTHRQRRTVAGLDEALRDHRFAAIVLDNRDVHGELPALTEHYRRALVLPAGERPRLYTGASVVPDSIWLPLETDAAPGTTAVADFEAATWPAGWTQVGAAWGSGAVAESLPGQGLVRGVRGHRFASSMHGGDAAIGRLTSPEFDLAAGNLLLRLGGTGAPDGLRVELTIGGAVARTATPAPASGDGLQLVTLGIGELRGQRARLVLIDESTTGHLDVDDVRLADP